MNKLNRVISIDLGKFPLRYIFLAIVGILTILSFAGESSHASELNALSPNRTETSNIKSIDLYLKNGILYVEILIDYIFPVTLEQHFILMHLEIIGNGVSLSIPTIRNNALLYDNHKKNVFKFDCPIFGNFTAKFYRSKTLLIERNFTNIPATRETNTSVLCTKDSYKKQCDFKNFCFKPKRLYWFSKDPLTFSHEPLQLNGNKSIITKEAPKNSLDSFMQSQNINDLIDGRNVIISMPKYNPYDWNWIEEYAAPAAELFSTGSKIEGVYCLDAPEEMIDAKFLSAIGRFSRVQEDDTICMKYGMYRMLSPTKSMHSVLHKKILNELKDSIVEHKVVLLVTNETEKYFSNILDAAKTITNSSDVFILNAKESEDVFSIIKHIANAEYVVSASGIMTSQAFWMNKGTFVEFIPSGYKNLINGEAPAKASGVNYRKILIDDKGLVKEENEEESKEGFPESPIQIQIEKLLLL